MRGRGGVHLTDGSIGNLVYNKCVHPFIYDYEYVCFYVCMYDYAYICRSEVNTWKSKYMLICA